MSKTQTYKCLICGTELRLKRITKEHGGSCPWCGEKRCWVDEDGEPRCIEYLDPASGGFFAVREEDQYGLICRSCVDSFWTYANTIQGIIPEASPIMVGSKRKPGKLLVKYLAGIGADLNDDFADSCGLNDIDDDVRQVVTSIIMNTRWRSTDAWRGYEETPNTVPNNWCKVLTGWHSSIEDSDLAERIHDVLNGQIPIDYPLLVVYERTSNVCSIGLSVYCRKVNAREVIKLLDARATPSYAGLTPCYTEAAGA